MNQALERIYRSSASNVLFVGLKECSKLMILSARRGGRYIVAVKWVAAQVAEVQ